MSSDQPTYRREGERRKRERKGENTDKNGLGAKVPGMTQPAAEVAAPPPLAPARPWHPSPGPCPSSTRDEGLESTKTLSPPRRGKPCSYTQPWLNQEDGHSLSLQLQGSRPPCYGFLIWVPASPQHRRAFPSPSPVAPPASGIPAASRHSRGRGAAFPHSAWK